MSIELSDNLELPDDAVTQKFAFMGRTGSGKTYGATKLCEQMLDLGAQVIVLDPVGVWYGLRMSADGKGTGYSLPIFGGLHGDVPLTPTSGKLIVDLVIDRNLSAIIDVSQMESDADTTRFSTDFARELFQRRKRVPAATHLFIDEAQEFFPQNIMKGEEMKLHVFTRLGKLGRNYGIGLSLMSQRPQEVNKKVLNMTECMLAFQMTGPQERDAVEAWVSAKGADKRIADELPHLKVGTAHIWSPQWLGISETIKIASRKTRDTSSTPKFGAKSIPVRELTPIDVERLRADMSDTIEQAKSEDPKELRAEIARLRRELQQTKMASPKLEVKRVEVPILSEEQIKRLETILTEIKRLDDMIAGSFSAFGKDLVEAYAQIVSAFNAVRTQAQRTQAAPPIPPARAIPARRPDYLPEPMRPKPIKVSADPGVKLLKAERRILIALAQYPQGRTKNQVAILTGYSVRGGGFANALGKLRSLGFIEGNGDRLSITDAGLAAIGSEWTPLPTGRVLVDYWMTLTGKRGLSKAARSALSVLVDLWPQDIGVDELAQIAGYKPGTGGFGNALGKLRTLELIVGRGRIKASDNLMEE